MIIMKKIFRIQSALVIIIILSLFSCSDDDNSISVNLQDLQVAINENPSSGQSVGTVQSNSTNALTFSIVSQTPTGALEINPVSGELTVLDPTLFDYEVNPIINATVAAAGVQNQAVITINIANIAEVNVQNFATTIDENPSNGQSIGNVQASGDATLAYSLTTESPAGALSINTTTGELTVLNANLFDYETNSIITATVQVDNSGTTESLTVTIDLEDKNEVGEYKFGGVIFWINSAGNEGLVCATTDQSDGIRWYNGTSIITNANGSSINTGQANTIAIVNAQGIGVYAAKICDDLNLNGYNDWFLPSHDELEEMHTHKSIIDNVSLANSGTSIQSMTYWCSTEDSLHAAETYSFTSTATPADFKSALHRVRAVRKWTDF